MRQVQQEYDVLLRVLGPSLPHFGSACTYSEIVWAGWALFPGGQPRWGGHVAGLWPLQGSGSTQVQVDLGKLQNKAHTLGRTYETEVFFTV